MIKQTGIFCSGEKREEYHRLKKEFEEKNSRPDSHCRSLWKEITHDEWQEYHTWLEEGLKSTGKYESPLCAICIWRQESWDKKEKAFLVGNFARNHMCEICEIDFELEEIAPNVFVKCTKEEKEYAQNDQNLK